MAEYDWAEVPYPQRVEGTAEPLKSGDDDHDADHTFLYIPDLAAQTGWSSHRVPQRKSERPQSRPIGFRRS